LAGFWIEIERETGKCPCDVAGRDRTIRRHSHKYTSERAFRLGVTDRRQRRSADAPRLVSFFRVTADKNSFNGASTIRFVALPSRGLQSLHGQISDFFRERDDAFKGLRRERISFLDIEEEKSGRAIVWDPPEVWFRRLREKQTSLL